MKLIEENLYFHEACRLLFSGYADMIMVCGEEFYYKNNLLTTKEGEKVLIGRKHHIGNGEFFSLDGILTKSIYEKKWEAYKKEQQKGEEKMDNKHLTPKEAMEAFLNGEELENDDSGYSPFKLDPNGYLVDCEGDRTLIGGL